tara:strand:+ start:5930 stop:8035 length:2106 start_codon:yes stop_codon:yes gene_type:complete
MATRKISQNSFNTGQVGPFMDGRVDSQLYKTGLETCENMLLLPQGGMQKRKGFKFISADPDNTTTPDGSTSLTTTGFHLQSRLIPFKFTDGQEYVIVLEPKDTGAGTEAEMHIFYQNTRVAHLTNGSGGQVFPITTAEIGDVRFTQSFDVMILVHPDLQPIQLQRGSVNTDWTASNLVFDFIPLANFSFGTTLTPSATSGNGINMTLSNGSYEWVNATAPNGHIGMHVNINGGLVELTGFTSSTVMTGNVIFEMVDTEGANGNEWELDAFSNLNSTLGGGQPRSVSFHQNRLIFGGTRDKPQTIFGSQSGDFFNFNPFTKTVTESGGSTTVTGDITDDAGFTFTIASDQLNIIRHLISQQSLFIFTSDGEFDMSGEPVTPSNVLVRQQTRYGIGQGVSEPVVVDNEVLFHDKSGKQCRAFVYNFNTDAYSAKNYSLIHHDILDGATSIAHLTNYSNNNTNYVVSLNSDGSLGILGINVEFSVVGWNKWTTNGEFKALGVVDDSLYVLARRYDNDGSTLQSGLFLEQLTADNIFLDSFHTTSASASSFTGAVGLEGQTVQVVADGMKHPDVTVANTGNFDLTRTSSSTQIGHGYTSTAKTLNLILNAPAQSTMGEKVRKVLVDIQLNESKTLEVDGMTVPFRELGTSLLGQAVSSFTGFKRMRMTGYHTSPQVTFTITDPLPCTILSIVTEVKFGAGKLQGG